MLMFVETPLFSRLVYDYISDVEYAALQGESLNGHIRQYGLERALRKLIREELGRVA